MGRDYGSFYWQEVPTKKYLDVESGQMMCIGPNFVAFSSGDAAWVKVEYREKFWGYLCVIKRER